MTLSENINNLAVRIGEEFASLKSSSVTSEPASSSGSVITLTDADDANLLALTLYGKSTQDETPSPESPAEITSIGDDGDLSVYTAGQNLLPPVVEAGTTATTSSGIVVSVSDDGTTFTVTAPADVSGAAYFTLAHPVTFPAGAYLHIRNSTAAPTMTFGVYKDGDWANRAELTTSPANRIGSPSKIAGQTFDKAYVYVSAGSGHDAYDLTLQPSIKLTDEVTDFEAYKGTYADISDIEPLRAVPTTKTTGNYTDADGTKWWADKLIVRSDGSGYIERICEEITLTEENNWSTYSYSQSPYYKGFVCKDQFSSIGSNTSGRTRIAGLCNFGPVSDSGSGIAASNAVWIGVSGENRIWIVNTDFYTDETDTSADDWGTTVLNAWLENLAENGPMKIIFYLEESTKEELTSDQVNALLALQSFTDTTHIYNEEDADMEVEYVQAGKTSITQILSQSVASTSARGVVELATAEETEEGTDETRAITPYAGEQVYLKKSGGTVSGDLTVEGTLNADSLSIDGYIAESAEKLENPVTIQTNLASTSAASFDGTANVTPGVTGILPVANGGTGSTAGAVLLTGAQTVAGTKTFSNSPVTTASYAIDTTSEEVGTVHTAMSVKPVGSTTYRPIITTTLPADPSYGVNARFGGYSATVVGAGESQADLFSEISTDSSEHLYLCADSQVRVVTNDSYGNRGVLNFSTSGDNFYIWHYPRIEEIYKGDTPKTGFNTQFELHDSTNVHDTETALAMLSLGKSTTRNWAELRAYTDTSGASDYAALGIYAPNGGGTAYTYAPTPASGDSSSKIATTAWVNNAISSGNAETASALENPVTIQTNLASTTAASFDGTANVAPGVTGILPVANGGTGANTATDALTALGAASASDLVTLNAAIATLQTRLDALETAIGDLADTAFASEFDSVLSET